MKRQSRAYLPLPPTKLVEPWMRPRRNLLLVPVLLVLSGCAVMPQSAPERRADAAYAAGDYAAAAVAYERLTAEQGDGAERWFRLGNSYVELGRLVDATAAFRTALERDPEHARAAHNLGLVYLQLGVTTLLESRRSLPQVDAASAATMRYLACIMETFMGQPDPVTCRGDTGGP